ncbi:MAG: Jag N-terminal domain-containing protein [Synergistaceae bacterium]|nr:Jag N-terminal domain-containing protein [Synergistaceae bacterium]
MTQERRMTIEAADIDEALREVSEQWKLPVEELHAEVVSSEREGFLGLFGSRKVMVEVSTNAKPDIMTRGLEFVDAVLRLMDVDAHAVASETERNMIDIEGDDAADYVVGRYGDALKGMEYLVNLALRDPKSEPRLKVDSCGYRARRTKSLERLAEATARQAVKYGRPVRLDPMASWERWVIHTTLKDNSDVTTESVGESPSRKVVVIPKYEPEEVRMPGPASMRIRAQRERMNAAGNPPPSSQRSYGRRRDRRDRRDNRENRE